MVLARGFLQLCSGGFRAAKGKEGFVQFRFAFPFLSSECQNLQIFLKFNNCLRTCPRQQLSEISEALRRHESGIKEFTTELWEPHLALSNGSALSSSERAATGLSSCNRVGAIFLLQTFTKATLEWVLFWLEGWTGGCLSSFPAFLGFYSRIKSAFTRKICNLPPSPASSAQALLSGFLLLQHNSQAILRVCGFISIPAKQPCLQVRSTSSCRQNCNLSEGFFPPLYICRCRKTTVFQIHSLLQSVRLPNGCNHKYHGLPPLYPSLINYVHNKFIFLDPEPQTSQGACTLASEA